MTLQPSSTSLTSSLQAASGPWQTAVATSCLQDPGARPYSLVVQSSANDPQKVHAIRGPSLAPERGRLPHVWADRSAERSTGGSRYPGAKPRTGQGAPPTRSRQKEVCHEFNGHAGDTSVVTAVTRTGRKTKQLSPTRQPPLTKRGVSSPNLICPQA